MANRARTLEFRVVVQDKEATQGLGRIEGQLSKTGAAFSTLAKGVAAYVGARELKDFAMTAIQSASAVEESMNAVNVVFGESAHAIRAFSEVAAETVGLSQSEFGQMAAELGSLLQGVGFSSQEAADQTISLTERAADMASIFNTDVSQALGAIQSALKGEFNPIERFGVKLSAATVEAKALSMGLAGTKKELTDTDKATAALAVVMEQTNGIAGDFQNTLDGAANSARVLAARTEDLKASIGDKLLPIWNRLLSNVDTMTWGVGKLADKWTDLKKSQEGATEAMEKDYAGRSDLFALFQQFGDWLEKEQRKEEAKHRREVIAIRDHQQRNNLYRAYLGLQERENKNLSDGSFELNEHNRHMRIFDEATRHATSAIGGWSESLNLAGDALEENYNKFFTFNGILWEIASNAQEAISQIRQAYQIAAEVAAWEEPTVPRGSPEPVSRPEDMTEFERLQQRRRREFVDTGGL